MKVFDEIKVGDELYLAEIKRDAVRVTPRTVSDAKKFKERVHINVVPTEEDKECRFTKMYAFLDDKSVTDNHGNHLFTTKEAARSWLIGMMNMEVRVKGNEYRRAQQKLNQAIGMKFD